MQISRQAAITIAANDVVPLANGPKNNKWQAAICCHHSYKPIIYTDFIYDNCVDAVKVAKQFIKEVCRLVEEGKENEIIYG